MPPGFGIPTNVKASSMTVFDPGGGAQLFVGTETMVGGPGCDLWSWNNAIWTCAVGLPVIPPRPVAGFWNNNNGGIFSLTQFGPDLYAGTRNIVTGCDVWKTTNAVNWTRSNRPGFAPNNNSAVMSATLFGGAVYFGTRSWQGCEVLRSPDGAAWTRAVGNYNAAPDPGPGFGNFNNREASSMTVFGNALYVGTNNGPAGCHVWRTTDGTNWTQVVGGVVVPDPGGGFGNPNNRIAASMAVFGTDLYVGTEDSSGAPGSGCEVWRTSDGFSWSPVVGGGAPVPAGFGSSNNTRASSIAVMGNKLYVGTWNSGGCEVWQSQDGVAWTNRVGGGAPVFPNPGSGFGSGSNTQAPAMASFSASTERLYVGTQNAAGCEVWRSADGTQWSRVVGATGSPPDPGPGFGNANNQGALSMRVFGRNLHVGTDNSNDGFDIWRTVDGINWINSATQGFSGSNNDKATAMVVNGTTIYAGTQNQKTGCEVYRENVAITSLGTTSGKQGETLNVVVYGANTSFIPNSSPTFGSGITVNGVAVTNDTQLTADITIQPNASLGTRDVNVITGNETPALLVGGFTVTNGTPSITSISPDNGFWGTEVTVNGTNFGTSRGTGFVTFGGAQSPEYTAWGDGQLKCKVPTDISAGKVQVSVTTAVGTSNANDFTVNPAAWYLAEGSTAWGFSCYITIENPNDSAVSCDISYMTETGDVDGGTTYLPAKSQATVNPRTALGDRDFSTLVQCLEGKPIAVDRTMTWTGGAGAIGSAAAQEAHNSVGVTAPSTTWYLPEGSSSWGFECWLLIQNPNTSEATCQVTYMIEGEGPKTVEHKVPALSRKTYNMKDDIGEKDASIQVTSNQPVIPERAMYRNNRREGHDSIGSTTATADYYLAEGTTAWGFTTYVLVQNPNASPANVTVTYMTTSGPRIQPAFTMPANSRKTIRVNDVEPNQDLSTQVHADQAILAERAMYWTSGGDEVCHDSIGMPVPHTTFYLPDGQTSEGRETWTLVQNPNGVPVEVEISYLTETGVGNVVFHDTVPANSRKTYNMVDKGISGRAAVLVTSKTSGQKIMVERAMYWNSRGAGTDTIGGYSD
jgi:hypothetical protein